MKTAGTSRIVVAGLLCLGAGVFLAGIRWGLPSKAVKAYLFGDRPAWSGAQIMQLADGSRNGVEARRSRGADVDADPIARSSQPVVLNETDRQRAQIARRYLLFSDQPDEMITLMSLASMRPVQRDFDPRLYQYGGLWIYPVGAMLKAGGLLGFLTVTGDLAYYLDNPHQFGRFYVAMRLYAVLWGLLGVWAVWRLALKLTGSGAWAVLAAVCFIAMPVVVNMAHEAKPHLPGAVLSLLAVLAAQRYVEEGKARWWLAAGAMCGAAAGMVLSALPVFLVLPAMVLLRRGGWGRTVAVLVAGTVVGVVVYGLANPYVAINLVRDRALLLSNLGNSAAMYHVGRLDEGLLNAVRLVAEGASPFLAAWGLLGVMLLAVVGGRGKGLGVRGKGSAESCELRVVSCENPQAATGNWQPATGNSPSPLTPLVLLALPGLAVAAQFVAFAAGKPGEYARFALLLDIVLLLAGVTAAAAILRRAFVSMVLVVVLLASTAAYGWATLRTFLSDAQPVTGRLVEAHRLAGLLQQHRHAAVAREPERVVHSPPALGLSAEPAPYCLPPVDLFAWKLVLLPGNPGFQPAWSRGGAGWKPAFRRSSGWGSDVVVTVDDAPRPLLPVGPARMSWADKGFRVQEVVP